MTHWEHRAECLGEDPELFFPIGSGTDAAKQTAQAKAVCAQCPVRAECRRKADTVHANDGVWGQLTPFERANVRRARYAKARGFDVRPCPTCHRPTRAQGTPAADAPGTVLRFGDQCRRCTGEGTKT